MNFEEKKEDVLKSSLTIGLMALSLFSFSGCSTKDLLKADMNNPVDPTYVDRGHNVFFIPTAEGIEASRAVNEILEKNPDKSISHFERTGSLDTTSSNGAGFILILEQHTH